MAKFTSITSATATILKQKTSFSRSQDGGQIGGVYISNNDSNLASVSLYIESYADSNVKHYMCKGLKIPVNVSVSVPVFHFDILTYKLMIHANDGGSAPNLTIITT
tara:strand:+ start:831 stop:1148 length:318 start_codon:yes stop_codon:yes gene_type:complete